MSHLFVVAFRLELFHGILLDLFTFAGWAGLLAVASVQKQFVSGNTVSLTYWGIDSRYHHFFALQQVQRFSVLSLRSMTLKTRMFLP
jgi:hypothetical protein